MRNRTSTFSTTLTILTNSMSMPIPRDKQKGITKPALKTPNPAGPHLSVDLTGLFEVGEVLVEDLVLGEFTANVLGVRVAAVRLPQVLHADNAVTSVIHLAERLHQNLLPGLRHRRLHRRRARSGMAIFESPDDS